MVKETQLLPIHQWFNLDEDKPVVIAGPCSAESEEQVFKTAKELSAYGVKVFRSGIWKPRTRPGSFEGRGEEALFWLKRVKDELGMFVATEVANAKHVDLALKHKVDVLWLGARTVSNPFSVQEIADAIKGLDIPVLIKNPLNPDLALWIGAIERILKSGTKKVAAVHRGFHPFEYTKYRNIPKWELPIELKTSYHHLPILIDPSHIAGKRAFLYEIAQKGLDLNMDGLMIEVHPDPEHALSDNEQQITPKALADLTGLLELRKNEITDQFLNQLGQYRNQIDSIDFQILELLHQRMKVVERIGELKCKNKVSVLQIQRWESILKTRMEYGHELGLSDEFLKKMLQLVHKEAIQKQVDAMQKCKRHDLDESQSKK